MRRRLLAISIFSLFLFPATMFAQEEYGFNEGDWDLTLAAGGSSANDFDNGSFAIQGSLGYLFDNWIEFGGRQSISYFYNGDSIVDGSTRAFVDFYMDMGRLQPFIGGSAGFIYGDEVSDSFEIGVEGGAKYFINTTTYAYAILEYLITLDEPFDEDRWVYAIGLGVRW